jgi:hypothetical protein
MENLQVYRTRFESSAPLISELDDRLPLVLDAKSESRPSVSSIAAQH